MVMRALLRLTRANLRQEKRSKPGNLPQLEMLTASKQSANLDILRSFAVLAVVMHHAAQTQNANNLGTLGRTGVLIFFVHTALVLMTVIGTSGQPKCQPFQSLLPTTHF